MNASFLTLLAVGSGGFIGAVFRFLMNITISKNFPSQIPLATLSVNVIGGFFIGILAALFISYTPPSVLKVFLINGFLGAFTTYSAFALESVYLFNSSIQILNKN